jgi:hypothetical protein
LSSATKWAGSILLDIQLPDSNTASIEKPYFDDEKTPLLAAFFHDNANL